MKVSALIIEAAQQYNDYNADAEAGQRYERLTVDKWVNFYNEAQKALVIARPDSRMKFVKTFELTADETLHALPAECLQLIDMPRNMGVDGATPGEPIKGPKSKKDIEAMFSDWHSETGVTGIEFFCYDQQTSGYVWTYPRAHASTKVCAEIAYSYAFTDAVEADIATTDIEAGVKFHPALKAWMLNLAFSVDFDALPNWNVSIRYEKSFFSLLGIEFKTGAAIAPAKEPGNG